MQIALQWKLVCTRSLQHDPPKTLLNFNGVVVVMENKEQKLEINLTQFEGTSNEIAEQVFKVVILPMLQQMSQQNDESSRVFAFSIMWLGMSQYAQFFPTNGAEKSINFAVDKLIEVLKQQRGELKI